MNYRHSYHAGNHTEVFKHSVLVLLLQHLRCKEKPFMVLDTHAGGGMYDLHGDEARRTREAEEGIGRIISKGLKTAAGYIETVRSANRSGELCLYPGSPLIIRSLLREGDRLIACELHPDDWASLRQHFRGDESASIHRRDGYEAVKAFIPPRERRGLVFIDPAFEDKDEFNRLADAVIAGLKKWRTGIFAAWYPIKTRHGGDLLRSKVQASRGPKLLIAEFFRFPEDGVRLAGSGVLICNAPWRLEEAVVKLCAELSAAFEAGGVSWSVERLSEYDC